MKKIIIVLTLFACMSAVVKTGNKTFKKLYALEGTWKMTTKRGVIYEEWKKMDNNYLQNRGYMVKANDTLVTERVALTNTPKGIFYISRVEEQNNKQPITFIMTSFENNKFVFENASHDFPKRIVYKLVTADSLHAFIDDGTETGKRQNFYFKKQ